MNSKSKSVKIIIDEEQEALRILSSNEKFFNYKSIVLLAKYYYGLGLDTRKVKKQISEYLRKIEFYNPAFYDDDVDKIIKKNKFYSLKRADVKIAITKKESMVLKKLNHKDYRVAVYMLFLGKLEKFQSMKKNEKKTKGFSTFSNHDIKSCAYNVGINLTHKEAMMLYHRLYLAKIIEPLYMDARLIICANYDDKDVEFIIDGKKDFLPQIKYYCSNCGRMILEKAKYHEFCSECYRVDLKRRNADIQRRKRESQAK